MRGRRFWGLLLTLILTIGCVVVPAEAAEIPKDDIVIARISGRLDLTVAANAIETVGGWISLDKNEIVKYSCSYTPSYANVDFGLIDSNGRFYYINCTSGSIDQSIEITSRGQYILAIRNKSSSEITVTGTVRY